ncbi:hypothetical protein WKV44_05830 [Spirochaetia bacterium 38H-sp]|uniref:Uncharacterized protein n=1 Tax=Rarispira pelagica TaxID=3141764 RepID=A0ABU9UBL6_9SPIR
MEVFNSLSPVIQEHIKQMAKTSGMEASDEAYEKLASAWREKEKIFLDAVERHDFEEVSFFSKDEERGALILTYSGSLLSLGPLDDGRRRAEYTSIGLRVDVPDSAVKEGSVIENDIETDSVVVFSTGPIQQSSPVYKIAISTKGLDTDEAEEVLTKVVQEISEEFAEINKTIAD